MLGGEGGSQSLCKLSVMLRRQARSSWGKDTTLALRNSVDKLRQL
jgi:hypothetical protein